MGVVLIEILGTGLPDLSIAESQIKGLLFEEDIWGSSRYMLHLGTPTDADWTAALQNPELRFQLRFKHVAKGQESVSATKTVRKDFATLSYLGDNTEIKLEGSDAGYDLLLSYKDSQLYKGTIGEMVQEIADRHSLKTKITSTLGPYCIWQCNYPDGWFIRNVLLPRAYSSTRSDYLFYIQNGDTVVFGPPDLSNEVATFSIPPGAETDKIFNVEAHEFDIRDTGIILQRSLVTIVRGFDRSSKAYVEFLAKDSTVSPMKLASTSPEATKDPTRTVVTYAPFHPNYDQRDVDNVGSAIWSAHMRSRYEVRIHLRGFLAIAPGDVFKVDVKHWLGGKYLCSGIRQWLNPKTWDLWTTVIGQRRERN